VHTDTDIRWIVRDELRRPEFREVVRHELEQYEFRKQGERFHRWMNVIVVAIWVLGLATAALIFWQGA
jgi:hypothetical protein